MKHLYRLLALAALLTACRPAPRRVVIGLGYANERRSAAVATVAADSGQPDSEAIRILSAPFPGQTPQASSPAAEVELAARLAAVPGMIGVVGHGGSREALMTAPIYNEARILQIVPTSTSRRLRDAGPWTFTLAPNDSVEGEFIGRFVAVALHARRVTLFYVLDEYGAGLRDGAVAALERRGIQVIDAVPVAPSGLCMPQQAENVLAPAVDAALLRGRPDAVVLATRQKESGCIVSRIRARYPAMRFIAGDGLFLNRDFQDRAGNAADSVFVVTFWHPDARDAASRAFVDRFRRIYGEDPTADDAMIYDALMTLVQAVRAVGPDGARIRGYLASLGRERPALAGVTGPIEFPARQGRLSVARIEGDHLRLVDFR